MIFIFYITYTLTQRKTLSLSVSSTEAATRDILLKKVFLTISQISQENTCVKHELRVASYELRVTS